MASPAGVGREGSCQWQWQCHLSPTTAGSGGDRRARNAVIMAAANKARYAHRDDLYITPPDHPGRKLRRRSSPDKPLISTSVICNPGNEVNFSPARQTGKLKSSPHHRDLHEPPWELSQQHIWGTKVTLAGSRGHTQYRGKRLTVEQQPVAHFNTVGSGISEVLHARGTHYVRHNPLRYTWPCPAQ
ncbi:hypothetical protein J6590_051661 [Homalodisca vitripennis]|nr:hypothetical protein J6590_051661 [Homalodisca vitripennis]